MTTTTLFHCSDLHFGHPAVPEQYEAIEALIQERVEQALMGRRRPQERRWLTLGEAAERLGCTTDAVRMRIHRGRLDHRRHGRRLYVSAASVDRLGPAV